MTLIEVLWAIKRKDPRVFQATSGICTQVWEHSDTGGRLRLNRYIRSWPEFKAGYRKQDYPVAHPVYSNEMAYVSCRKWKGEYGGNRMRLLNWCIRQEEARLAKQAR